MAEAISVASINAIRNLPSAFFLRAAEFGDRPFLGWKTDSGWRTMSWNDAARTASRLSRGLRALGVAPGDAVVLCAENRPEWALAEIAILAAGAVAVPAYTTNTPPDHLHVLNNVKAKAAIVSTKKLAANVLQAAIKCNSCAFVVAVEQPVISQELAGMPVHLWDDVLKKGDALPDDVREAAEKPARDAVAVVIHTSGTGGAPRGVQLHHGSILANCAGAWGVMGPWIDYGREKFLSFLPLSHAYEHAAGQWLPIVIGAQIYYAEGLDALVGNMADVKPTIMTAVPRLYEVMHGRVAKAMNQMTGLRKTLFEKALAIGRKRYENPASLTFMDKLIDPLLDRVVRSKVRGRFGGHLKFFVAGGAPLNYEVGLFFHALGATMLQGYGQTEAGPVISVNRPDKLRIDTVGVPLTGVEVRIAEDGEILVRGELVMKGYINDPEATAFAIRDGWLHTGDVADAETFRRDGQIKIVDRKKDIIVNSGGDNVSPQRVEGFLTLQPEIAQAMVFGDKRPHLVAVLVPDPEAAAAWARTRGKKADLDSLVQDPEFHDVIAKALDRVNHGLSPIERVRRFLLTAEPFTTDNEMLTPSLKIRRHMIKKKYGERLEALYGKK